MNETASTKRADRSTGTCIPALRKATGSLNNLATTASDTGLFRRAEEKSRPSGIVMILGEGA